MTFCSSGDQHIGLLLTLLIIKERKKCHYVWWFVRQSTFLQSVLMSSPLIFVQPSYYFVISIVMTYSYIFTVTGGATAYQSSKFFCTHLSHLITVRVNTSCTHLAMSSCCDVAGCLLYGLSFSNSWESFKLWYHSNTIQNVWSIYHFHSKGKFLY